jgi:pSer/pThr/pTyr-binding forkhead associated (FHA) protein
MELPNGELEVQDLNSTNGTFINGTRIQNARLTSGDCLKIGRLELIALKNDD